MYSKYNWSSVRSCTHAVETRSGSTTQTTLGQTTPATTEYPTPMAKKAGEGSKSSAAKPFARGACVVVAEWGVGFGGEIREIHTSKGSKGTEWVKAPEASPAGGPTAIQAWARASSRALAAIQ